MTETSPERSQSIPRPGTALSGHRLLQALRGAGHGARAWWARHGLLLATVSLLLAAGLVGALCAMSGWRGV